MTKNKKQNREQKKRKKEEKKKTILEKKNEVCLLFPNFKHASNYRTWVG